MKKDPPILLPALPPSCDQRPFESADAPRDEHQPKDLPVFPSSVETTDPYPSKRSATKHVSLLLLLLVVACEPYEPDCERLARELERCDLPPARLACERLEPREARALAARFEELECDAPFTEGDDNLDFGVCDLLGWECPAPLFEDPRPQATLHPLVFVGGIDGSAGFGWNRRILDAVREIGPNRVYDVQPSPWSIPEVRARELERALEEWADGSPTRFNLICWAVGGIDCRYLASDGGLGRSDRIASITTIATPHRGTNVAQAALDLAEGDARAIISAIAGGTAPPDETALEVTLSRLTPEAMEALNLQITDAPGISYQSWAGTTHLFGQPWVPSEAALLRDCRDAGDRLLLARSGDGYDVMSALLVPAAPFAGDSVGDSAALLRPSDGMVAVTSAQWGEFRGCVPADHYDLAGQIGDRGIDPSSGFDAAIFYRNLAVDLARRGL